MSTTPSDPTSQSDSEGHSARDKDQISTGSDHDTSGSSFQQRLEKEKRHAPTSEPSSHPAPERGTARDALPDNNSLGEDHAFADPHAESETPIPETPEPEVTKPEVPEPEATEFPAITPEVLHSATSEDTTNDTTDSNNSVNDDAPQETPQHDTTLETALPPQETPSTETTTDSEPAEQASPDTEPSDPTPTTTKPASDTTDATTPPDEHTPDTDAEEEQAPRRITLGSAIAVAFMVVILVLAGIFGALWMTKNNNFATTSSTGSSATPSKDRHADRSDHNFPIPGGKTIKGSIGDTINLDARKVQICGGSTGEYTRSAIPVGWDCSVADASRQAYNDSNKHDRDHLSVRSPVSGSMLKLDCQEFSPGLIRCENRRDDLHVYIGN
ncbi:hypothetical protein ACGE24_05380 [Corynebacterium kroppenstedtii]|uniref:hypothetical protein n=1 Tax=Corynebacterium sp. PCR 32 TaxID=3351342 RepID=UPI0030A79AFF